MRNRTKLILFVFENILLLLLVLIIAAIFFPKIIGKMNMRDIERKTENYAFLNKDSLQGQTVFIGDSITEYYPLHDFFEDYTKETGQIVYNRGISAEYSDHLLSRMGNTVLNLKPKILVILIGINDIDGKVSIDDIYANIKDIVEKTQSQSQQTKILLQAVYPVNEAIEGIAGKISIGKRTNAEIQKLNLKLKALAGEKGISFLDLTHMLSDENGNMRIEYAYDGLHPSINAYKLISEEIEKELIKLN